MACNFIINLTVILKVLLLYVIKKCKVSVLFMGYICFNGSNVRKYMIILAKRITKQKI